MLVFLYLSLCDFGLSCIANKKAQEYRYGGSPGLLLQ